MVDPFQQRWGTLGSRRSTPFRVFVSRQASAHIIKTFCDSCPICQGAATLEQVNPELITDLAEMARSVVSGLASAMASASDQRDPGREPREDAGDVPAVTDLPEPAEGSVTDDYDDPDAADPDADGPQA